MALDIPDNAQEVIQRSKTDVQRELPESNPFLPNSVIGAFIVAFSNRIFDFYLQLKEAIKQAFWNTSTGTFLETQAAYFGIIRLAATQAEGNVVATGTLGETIPAGSGYQSSNGLDYESTASVDITANTVDILSLTRSGSTVTAVCDGEHNLASNVQPVISGAVETEYNGAQSITIVNPTTFTYEVATTPTSPATGTIEADFESALVPIISDDFGDDVNQQVDAPLTLTSNIPGIDAAARVDAQEIAGGSKLESDDSLRERFLFRVQNPVAHFNVAEVETKAKEINGVTRVFIFQAFPIPGQVTIYFMRDNDADPIPTAPEIAAVKDNILTIKPVNTADDDVIVDAPTAVETDYTFTAISPDTVTMREAITANLEQFYDEETSVGVDVSEDAYRSAIFNTVDPETGDVVESFTLSAPSGDIAIAADEIGTLGTVAYP